MESEMLATETGTHDRGIVETTLALTKTLKGYL